MIDISVGYGPDVPAIMPVMDDAFDPAFGEAWTAAQCLSTLAIPDSQLLIARLEGQVAGFALSRWVSTEEELLLIGVAKEKRRKGLGQALVGKLIKNAREDFREILFLEMRAENEAFAFYRELGFNPVGKRPAYYKAKDGNRYDAITMAMNL